MNKEWWVFDNLEMVMGPYESKELAEIETKEQKDILLSGVDRHDVEIFYSDIIKSRIEKELRSKRKHEGHDATSVADCKSHSL